MPDGCLAAQHQDAGIGLESRDRRLDRADIDLRVEPEHAENEGRGHSTTFRRHRNGASVGPDTGADRQHIPCASRATATIG